MDRRKAIVKMSKSGAGLYLLSSPFIISSCSGNSQTQEGKVEEEALFFSISLAQWSLNHSFFGESRKLPWPEFGKRLAVDPDSLIQGDLNPDDFPIIAKQDFGIEAVEYVNTFYFSKKNSPDYWNELKNKCDGEGVKSLLIMCDAEGNLGSTDDQQRNQAVENHYGWVDIASKLGCHSIRVNAAGEGTSEEVKSAAVAGLGMLTEYGEKSGINIIVENHGGYSSNGQWLSDVIAQVGSEYCGTLPDFGNFCIDRGPQGCKNEYDKYKGVKELMPYAKGVSAKSYGFDEKGNETSIDYKKMLRIVKNSGFTGYVGIEYEGSELSEKEGIIATKRLLQEAGKMG